MRSLFRQRAVIERDAGTADSYGGETAADWQPHLDALPCRTYLRTLRGNEATDADRTAAVDEIRMLIPAGTDVTAADRVAVVKDRLGNTVYEGPLRIDSIGRHTKNIELLLRTGN